MAKDPVSRAIAILSELERLAPEVREALAKERRELDQGLLHLERDRQGLGQGLAQVEHQAQEVQGLSRHIEGLQAQLSQALAGQREAERRMQEEQRAHRDTQRQLLEAREALKKQMAITRGVQASANTEAAKRAEAQANALRRPPQGG